MSDDSTERVLAALAGLRADLLARSERVLDEVALLRDDMAIVMARLDRMDATAHATTTEVKALYRQASRVAARAAAEDL